jgi:hypothetical protein
MCVLLGTTCVELLLMFCNKGRRVNWHIACDSLGAIVCSWKAKQPYSCKCIVRCV